jgi:flagellar motor switch protein FliN
MKDVTPAAPLVEALAREVADACAALLGATTAITCVEASGETGWIATIACSGALAGSITVGLSEADGRRLSALVMAMDDSPDEAVIDTLREVCGQAVSSLSQQAVAQGLTLAVTDARRVAETANPAGPDAAFEFELPDGVTPRLVVHVALVAHEPRVVPAAPAVAHVVDAGRVTAEPAATGAQGAPNLDVLLDVELPVAVRFGQTELPLLSLVRLGPGAVIDLRRSADEPVDVLVGGKVIARGDVVVVDGNYGVRVTQIVSTAERIRSMGA